jgi:hypothetical protein
MHSKSASQVKRFMMKKAKYFVMKKEKRRQDGPCENVKYQQGCVALVPDFHDPSLSPQSPKR